MDRRIERLPEEFLEKVKSVYPDRYVQVCNTYLKDKPTTFRVNLLKTDLRELRKSLLSNYVRFREIHDVPGAFMLEKTTLRELQATDIYKKGHIYVQNISSMIPVIVLLEGRDDFQGNIILDLCAAPGGKTTQIASLTAGKADIRAVEIDKTRFFKLKANVDMQGAHGYVRIFNRNGQDVFKDFENYFDYVLVDAPCSCEAGFNVNDPRSYSYWSTRKVNECRSKQKRLLFSGLKCLKPGGTLVYSTCTISPEENEGVVNWALSRFEDVSLDTISFPMKGAVKGLLSWNNKDFDRNLTKTRRILPSELTEGFYMAKFRKK